MREFRKDGRFGARDKREGEGEAKEGRREGRKCSDR